MHGFEGAPPGEIPSNSSGRWYSELTRYHWFVLIVAALGWLFDCLDQQLFILARPAAMADLLPKLSDPAAQAAAEKMYGNYATSIFLMGWASGGLFFGVLGDRIGRAKTMLITILMYSVFTGLSAASQGFWDFAFYRFLTGLGVGGEFAVGVALVAEVMPARARPYSLALLQALSAIGNVSAALIAMGFGLAEEEGLVNSPWRYMFLVGALPALLCIVIRRNLKEPERWKAVSHEGAVEKQLGSYRELMRHPTWRKHAIFGLVLACSGVIGLWGVGFFTPDLMRTVQTSRVTMEVYAEREAQAQAAGNEEAAAAYSQMQAIAGSETRQAMPDEFKEFHAQAAGAIEGRLKVIQGWTSITINLGAFLGMFGFGLISQKIGRRPTFLMAFLAAYAVTVYVFLNVADLNAWFFVMVMAMGFCQLSLFAGYAIFFPELFPTHLRSTGTSFCYNVGRFLAASGPFVSAHLIGFFNQQFEATGEPMRYAGVVMSSVFLIGILALPFLPETTNKPLPE